MKVIISIVNFNTVKLTKNCLKSIFSGKNKNDLEVWVVDNASSDDSVEKFKKNFPNVKLVVNSSNVGFGAGHNIVFKKTSANYFLVLNSDCEVSEGAIDGMVSFMELHQDFGIASPKVTGFDGKLQPNAGDLPGAGALLGWLFNLESLGFQRSLHRNENAYYEEVKEVGWVSGNFMMIREEVFKKIGYFDEDYFMYFEDTDLCSRAKKAGFKIMLNPKVSIKHLSGGSLDEPSLRQWSGEYKGLYLYYHKHYGAVVALFVRLLMYLSIVLRIIAFGLTGKVKISQTYGKVIFKV